MLLQSILQLFDQELARLRALRDIVADLATPSDVVELPIALASVVVEVPAAPEPVPIVEPAPPKRTTTRAPKGFARAAVGRKAPARKARPVDHGALTSAIPAGPVVVSADRLQVKKAAVNGSDGRNTVAPVKEGTLGSMIRALHLRLPQE